MSGEYVEHGLKAPCERDLGPDWHRVLEQALEVDHSTVWRWERDPAKLGTRNARAIDAVRFAARQRRRPPLSLHDTLLDQRALIVEDNFILAHELDYALKSAGCLVIGYYGTCEEALAVIRQRPIDLAVLDVTLDAGKKCWPIARELISRRVPFVFATGSASIVAERPPPDLHWQIRDLPVVLKPYDPDQVAATLLELLGAKPTPSAPSSGGSGVEKRRPGLEALSFG